MNTENIQQPDGRQSLLLKAAIGKARKQAFTQAAEYVKWAKHHFKTHTEIEYRLREMAEEAMKTPNDKDQARRENL